MCLQDQKLQKRKRNFKNAPYTTKKKDDNLTNQTTKKKRIKSTNR